MKRSYWLSLWTISLVMLSGPLSTAEAETVVDASGLTSLKLVHQEALLVRYVPTQLMAVGEDGSISRLNSLSIDGAGRLISGRVTLTAAPLDVTALQARVGEALGDAAKVEEVKNSIFQMWMACGDVILDHQGPSAGRLDRIAVQFILPTDLQCPPHSIDVHVILSWTDRLLADTISCSINWTTIVSTLERIQQANTTISLTELRLAIDTAIQMQDISINNTGDGNRSKVPDSMRVAVSDLLLTAARTMILGDSAGEIERTSSPSKTQLRPWDLRFKLRKQLDVSKLAATLTFTNRSEATREEAVRAVLALDAQ